MGFVCQLAIRMIFFRAMRIIAGTAKGRTVRVPQCAATRPSTDKVRSAIFSILESMQPDWSQALDLFAGTGAIGLEALSRGFDRADFVDQDRRCCATIKQNVDDLGFSNQAHVYCGKVSRVVMSLSSKYGVVFLDPPYADDTLPEIVQLVASSGVVLQDGVVVVLHSARRTLDERYAPLQRVKERRYGDTVISLYKEEVVS